MAKLYQHRTDGTYYTKRFEGGMVTCQIHPDGVCFLKMRGVGIGDDIPPFAMSELVTQRWLFTKEEAAKRGNVAWSPEWSALVEKPPAHDRSALSRSGAVASVDIPRDAGIVPVVIMRQAGEHLPVRAVLLMVLVALVTVLIGANVGG